MKTIPLTRGKVALVDDEDYERLSKFKWYAFKTAATGRLYAARGIRYRKPNGKVSSRLVFMHNEIMGIRLGFEVDHESRDSLDNCRANLRWATRSQNQCNTTRRRASTGFRGVYAKKDGRFISYIVHEMKHVYLGIFATAVDAALAWDAAALRLRGQFASLNFTKEQNHVRV